MSLQHYLKQARRYQIENKWQSAWPFAMADDIIEALAAQKNAIVEIAIAYKWAEKIWEEFPTTDGEIDGKTLFPPLNLTFKGFEGVRFFTPFQETVSRELGESWPDFVLRSQTAAIQLKTKLLLALKNTENVAFPPNFEPFCRISWHSEKEWEETFGLNLIQIYSGDYEEPEIGEDKNKVRYVFKYPGEKRETAYRKDGSILHIDQHLAPSKKAGRRIFRIAEYVAQHFDEISEAIAAFTKVARREILPDEETMPYIVSFHFTYSDDWQDISILAIVDDQNPANEPLYDYWKVQLVDFKPVLLLW